jgi:ankyrin repeat protein
MPTIDAILDAENPAFARAIKAIITGNVVALRTEISAQPALVHARSASPHHAMLLHYVAANGIEPELQGQVANADEIAAMLLAAGADVDAKCDVYCQSTTMDLLVSSDHPYEAGVAGKLVELLCSSGAPVDGIKDDGSPLAAALCFAILDCVHALLARGAHTENVIFAATAGRADWVRRWLDGDDSVLGLPPPAFLPLSSDRAIAAEQALVFASMCGQLEIVRFLVSRGVNVNANPPGSHWTATPLHTAAIQGQAGVVKFLLESGADPTIKDARHHATPMVWSAHARGPRKAFAQEVAKLLCDRN